MFVNYGLGESDKRHSDSDFEGELVLTDIISRLSLDTDEKPSDEEDAYRDRSAELRLLSMSTIEVNTHPFTPLILHSHLSSMQNMHIYL